MGDGIFNTMGGNNNYFEELDDELLSAQIVEFTRAYQAEEFPNPDRNSCPSNETIAAVLNLGKLPEPELREHLLSCSPCFNAFQAARESKTLFPMTEESIPATKWFSLSNIFAQPFPAIALSALICGIAVIVIYVWTAFFNNNDLAKQTNSEPLTIGNQTDNSQNSSSNSNVFLTENRNVIESAPEIESSNLQQSPNRDAPALSKEKRTAVENEPKLLAKNIIKLDLAKTAGSRNETSRERIFSLPSRNVSLRVKLPANSPAGDYDISLLDETGSPLLESRTKYGDGRFLTTDLDLRKKRGRARLCIAPKGEVPDCFAVSIGNNK
jgi:hypothetical protein